MRNFFSQAPFALFLIPSISAIIVSSYCFESLSSTFFAAIAILLIISSQFITPKNSFKLRWMFGMGIFFAIFSLTLFSFQIKRNHTNTDLNNSTSTYIGIVSDIPQEKPKSIAIKIKISYPTKMKVVAYFQDKDAARQLSPGEEIIFNSKITSFKNMGNPDDFDYKRYMNLKGFSGNTYIISDSWSKTGCKSKNIRINSANYKHKILEKYKNFELNHDAYSFISALTLGYKEELSNEIKEAFRASGTSHVLALSGLHVGIIYAVLAFTLSFLRKNRKQIITQQTIIIIALWIYAFITGLSPSVLRATIMLSIVSFGMILEKKAFTYNSVAAAAFLILIFNPFQLFDVGFQMSFASVLSILYLNPLINAIYKSKNRISNYIWSILSISIAAQLGVFPIALYYFGTFPTYFFISNLIIVPMTAIVIYICITLISISPLLIFKSSIIISIFTFCKTSLEYMIEFVLKTVYFIENLPFSQIEDVKISLLMTLTILAAIFFIAKVIKDKSPKDLIISNVLILYLILILISNKLIDKEKYLAIFNTPNKRDIGLMINEKRIYFNIPDNGYISHSNKIILSLTQNKAEHITVKEKIKLDILILSYDNSFSISRLNEIFKFNTLIIDSTVPTNVRRQWKRECYKLDINLHDISEQGAYLIKI